MLAGDDQSECAGLARQDSPSNPLFHLLEDTVPPFGHIVGVVHTLVRQLQEPDGFGIAKALKNQFLDRLFRRPSVLIGRSRWIAE